MEDLDIPIFKKSYDLYKDFYALRNGVPKQDKFAIWVRSENLILEVLESIVAASQHSKIEKLPILQKASIKLNFLIGEKEVPGGADANVVVAIAVPIVDVEAVLVEVADT